MVFAFIAAAAMVTSVVDKDMPFLQRHQPDVGTVGRVHPAPRVTRSNITSADFTITEGDTIRIKGERAQGHPAGRVRHPNPSSQTAPKNALLGLEGQGEASSARFEGQAHP